MRQSLMVLSLVGSWLIPSLGFAAIAIVSEDVSVWSTNQSGNENSGVLYVGNNTGSSGVARSYFKFSLPSFVSGTQITSATLSGHYQSDYDNEDGLFDWHLATTDAWSDAAITWNNQPGPTGGSIALWDSTGAVPNQIFSWDITSTVNQEYQGDGTLSLVFKSAVEGSTQNWEYWYGSEAGTYPFQIEYTVAQAGVPEHGSLTTWSMLALAVGGIWWLRRVNGAGAGY